VPKSQIFQGFLALFTFKKDKSEATSLGLCLQSDAPAYMWQVHFLNKDMKNISVIYSKPSEES
jgi:hypothetical protein